MKLQCKGNTKKRPNENLDRNSAKIREESKWQSNGNQMKSKNRSSEIKWDQVLLG